MLRELLTRMRFFFLPKKMSDLDEEIRSHLEQATQAKIAEGMSAADARRQSRIEFGGLEQTMSQCHRQRPGWLFETIAQDLLFAIRGVRRNPVFAITAVATLAIGIGATAAVLSVVDRILFRSLPYAEDNRLVSVGLTAPIIPEEFMLGGSYYVWRDNQKPFDAFTSETGVNACDLTERNPARLGCASVEANFLPTLGVAPLLGRNFLPEEDKPNGPKVALISYGLWQSHYGRDPGVIDRMARIDGHAVRIVGVLPANFEMPALEPADILVPQALDEAEQRKADPGRVMYSFARLKPGVTEAQAQAQLEPLFQYSLSLAPAAFRKEVHLRVRSLRVRQTHDVQLAAWVLLGAVLCMLLIACANVTSLMLARGAARERELAVRLALGASRGRLARHALTESTLFALCGAAAGLAFAELLLRAFIVIAPAGIPFLDKAQIDFRIFVLTTIVSMLCAVLFGLLPALQKPRSIALTARSTRIVTHAWTRRSVVAGQIAISMVLVSGSALLLRSFASLENQPFGLQTHGVITASISLGEQHYATPQQQMQFFTRVESALKQLPGATSVAVSDSLPPSGWHHETIFARMTTPGSAGTASGTGGMVAWRSVTPDYFRALQIPVVRGRTFTEAERNSSDRNVVLDNLLATRLFAGKDPLRQPISLTLNGPLYTVIGVTADVKNAGLSGGDEPEYYLLRRNLPEDWGRYSVFIVETSLAQGAVIPWMKSQIASIDPTVPVEIETMRERVNQLADRPRFETALLGFFALAGLVMAVIGVYGVTSFLATQRTQEFGIRMALGASRSKVLQLIFGEGIRILALGGVTGLIAAAIVTRYLSSLLFNVGPHDPASFVAAALLLSLAASLAALLPARSAMKTDPMVALRYE